MSNARRCDQRHPHLIASARRGCDADKATTAARVKLCIELCVIVGVDLDRPPQRGEHPGGERVQPARRSEERQRPHLTQGLLTPAAVNVERPADDHPTMPGQATTN